MSDNAMQKKDCTQEKDIKTNQSWAWEKTIYEAWEQSGIFACNPESNLERFCLMMPPPNVTGNLHMGHALTFTIQDILVRWNRMQGKNVLWQPGTDHAGIATQMVVERNLATKGLNRREMGREAFLDEVWKWKHESGGNIVEQLRRLGVSADWDRQKFTLDPDLSRAVTHAFTRLYNDGLIYRDKRLVNWDPKLQTAISDLEVEQREVKGKLYYIRYPIDGGTEDYITVATTRPETMLGDAAVAVHPENEKLKQFIGKYVCLPIINRKIPIIADTYADPEKGTGAVKITPAHDFNDYAVWERHRHSDAMIKLPAGGLINIFNEKAEISHDHTETPKGYDGLDRFAAREKIIADLEYLKLVDKIEDYVHIVPHGDRSGVPIEPFLTEQWYCNAPELGKAALSAVEEGRIRFVPEQWTNTYFAWMRDLKPWCISRQLWWGHRIPVWYGTDDAIFVAETAAEAIKKAEEHYQNPVELVPTAGEAALRELDDKEKNAPITRRIYQDEDVLDTWFSSALWPFSTLGWPDKDQKILKRYYPTDTLVTGFDIIFFWVARMIMMGLYFMGDVPFRTVYIHALVRDAKGQKMSKTKGNVIDPLETINQYGCDALRFTLASMSTPGRDIRLAASRIEGNRNFITKLRSAVRFADKNNVKWNADFDASTIKLSINKWIIAKTKIFAETLKDNIENYRFDLAAQNGYDFVWNTVCDWYIEFAKSVFGQHNLEKLQNNAEDINNNFNETAATLGWVLYTTCNLLHPLIPYVTQQLLNEHLYCSDNYLSMPFPDFKELTVSEQSLSDIGWLISVIAKLRAIRAELNVPANALMPLIVQDANDGFIQLIDSHRTIIQRLARVGEIKFVKSSDISSADGCASVITGEITLLLPIFSLIDIEREKERINKEIQRCADDLRLANAKLGDIKFLNRAPPDVLEEHRTRRDEAKERLNRLSEAQKVIQG